MSRFVGMDHGCLIRKIVDLSVALSPVDGINNRWIFHLSVDGELRDPRAYLRATAIKLAKELEELEDMELSDKEVDEMQDWCHRDQFHPGQAGKEPESHKRHEATVTDAVDTFAAEAFEGEHGISQCEADMRPFNPLSTDDAHADRRQAEAERGGDEEDEE
jgi:hypothetical protein